MNRTIRLWLSFFLASVCLVVHGAADAVEISEGHPLLVFPAAQADAGRSAESYSQSTISAWAGLPEFYQSHAAMSIPHLDVEMTVRNEWSGAVLDGLKKSGIPLALGVANGGHRHYFLPETIESLLKTYPSIEVLVVENFAFDRRPASGDLAPLELDAHVEWLKFVVSLAAQHKKTLLIRMEGLNPLVLASNPAYRSLYDALAKNKDRVVLVYPQGDAHTIAGNTSFMGLWLEGAIGHWGMAMDSATLSRAGLLEPGRFGRASAENTASSQMTSVYRGWLLNGAMTGATVFMFDNADELWAGTEQRFWSRAIAPTLLEIIQKGYIARKDLVQRSALVAYRLKPSATWGEFEENLADLDGVNHRGKMMHGVYGLEQPGQIPEWIPQTGRYYYVPVLSPYASDDVLFSFKEVMMPGAVLNAAAWQERLNDYYKADGEGTAFVKRVGRAFFVFNTRENVNETQTYTIANAPAPMHDISATRSGTKVTVGWPFREGDVSYSVYRTVNPDMEALHAAEFVEIAKGIDTRTYVDQEVAAGELVVYSVTAVTNERQSFSGNVQYGEYTIISAVESRRDGFAMVEPYTMRGQSINGLAPVVTPDVETKPWWGLPESDQAHVVRAGEAIAQILVDLSDAYRREDVDAMMKLISEDYSDSSRTSKPVLRDMFASIFGRYAAGPVHRQLRGWDLNDFEFSGEIIVDAFVQFTAQEGEEALVPRSTVSFPQTGDSEFRITFYEDHEGRWRIKHCEPPLLRVQDVAGQ